MHCTADGEGNKGLRYCKKQCFGNKLFLLCLLTWLFSY